MNIIELNDEELRVFLEGQSVAFLRDIFTNINSLRDKLKGFRPNKAPLDVLVQTSFKLIKREKNVKLIEILARHYNDYIKDINETIKILEKDGYPHYAAMATMVNKSFNDDFRKVYYKLEEISEEEQKKIDEMIVLMDVIEIYSLHAVNKEHKEDFEKIETLDEHISDFKDELKDSNKSVSDLDNKISNLATRIESIKKELLSSIESKADNNLLNQRIESLLTKLKADLKDLSKNDEVIALKKEIEALNKRIDSIPITQKESLYKFEHITNDEFDEMDDCEYLNEDIGDVLEDLISQDKLDVLREHIIETVYGRKPIITTTKNIDIVCDIYASILTGGEYYSIAIGEEYSLEKLIVTIEKISTEKTNLVLAIKGFINIHDYRNLLGYLFKHPFTHIFIFDMHYIAEARFMAPEILNEFYFFFADLSNKQIKYKYSHVFANRKTVSNSAYEKTLSQIGVSLDDTSLYNVKFYGQLAYSIIPFISANTGIQLGEVINQIIDPDTRRKCEIILDD